MLVTLRFMRNSVRALVAGLVGVGVLAGCASSPKENLIKAADEKCGTMNQRFAGDLAYGATFGSAESLSKLRQRAGLITDLRDSVKAMPAPESDQAGLNDWLKDLGTLIGDMNTMNNAEQNAQPGMDMVLVMQLDIIDEDAQTTSGAAAKFGFVDCARVTSWKANLTS
jgi:hypothetical protein